MALIAAACVSFVLLAAWNVETLDKASMSTLDIRGLIILLLALIAARMKLGAIKLLIASGVLGLLFGLFIR